MAKDRARSYEMDLCTGPVLGKMIRFTIPLMLSSMLQTLFNMADVVVVGRFAGDKCLAAVGSTGSLCSLVVNLFLGLAGGVNVVIARLYGARDGQKMRRAVHTAMLVSLVCGLFLMLVGVLGARQFLTWMGSPEDVIGLSTLYLRIYFCGMPAMMLYNFGSSILRAVGDTRRPLFFLFTAGVVNVVLNLFFVIVCGMDVAGVGIATVISQCISAGLIVACLMRSEGFIHLDLRALCVDGEALKDIARIGIPAGLQGMTFSVSNVIIQSSINAYGSTVMAASSASGNLEGIVYVAMNSVHQAAVSFTSQNYGARRLDRIRRILGAVLLCVTTVGVVLGVGVWLMGGTLLKLYTTSPTVIEQGQIRLFYLSMPYVFCGLMDVMVGMLRGIGYSFSTMVMSIVGVCGLRILWVRLAYRLPVFHNISGVYIAYPISWIVTFAAQCVCFAIAMKRVRRRMEAQE